MCQGLCLVGRGYSHKESRRGSCLLALELRGCLALQPSPDPVATSANFWQGASVKRYELWDLQQGPDRKGAMR